MKRIKSGTSVDYGGTQFRTHQLLGEIIALEDVMQYPPTALKYAQVYSFKKRKLITQLNLDTLLKYTSLAPYSFYSF